jgi:hypothetical protein
MDNEINLLSIPPDFEKRQPTTWKIIRFLWFSIFGLVILN